MEIERVHLEEDTGKSLHVGGATGRIHGADYSLVDYNRAGIPLVEIVTKPVTGTGALAPAVARRLRRGAARPAARPGRVRRADGGRLAALRREHVAGARGRRRMGHPDRDQERELAPLGGARGPVRDRAAGRAAGRGQRIVQETRHFQEATGTTTPGRSKEEAQDYRYFPEPDLVPLAPPADWVEEIRARGCPELPAARRARLQAEWGLSDLDMAALRNAGALDLVAETVAAGASPADARKWWLGELAPDANESGTDLADLPITPADVARVSALVEPRARSTTGWPGR